MPAQKTPKNKKKRPVAKKKPAKRPAPTRRGKDAIQRAFKIEGFELLPPQEILIRKPATRRKAKKGTFTGHEAFLPPQPALPKGLFEIGGIPVKRGKTRLVWPDIEKIRRATVLFPWLRTDWLRWHDFVTLLNPCRSVPAKTSVVKIPTHALTNMVRVSKDCALVYTVADDGVGCVVNVITEQIDAAFTVATNPSPTPAHPGGITPLVHPFTKGGINHKYKRLYVPASFYSTARVMANGGFYVAVVDIDPTSANYLDTIDWIDCGWIPEEVSFSDDEETGVIANYMQGTATFFTASNGQVIGAKERGGFNGAVNDPGEAYARSVRCGNIPGIGNRAFMTLTDKTPKPGIAVFDLDNAPNFARTNIDLSGFVDGVALTPDRRRLLALTSASLLVVKIDVAAPFVERTIPLPAGANQSYFGGIAVRPTGDLAFVATGNANSTSSTQGTSLTQVNWMTGTTLEVPGGLASQTWGLEIHSFGSNLKPHIFVCSRSGELAIIPC